MIIDVCSHFFERHAFLICNFGGVNNGQSVVVAYHNMIIFMLGEPVVKRCFINKRNYFTKIGYKTHFFVKSSFSSLYITFAVALMAAARIGPQPGRVVFVKCTLL